MSLILIILIEDDDEDEEDLDLDRSLALGPNNYNPVHVQTEGSSKTRSANLRVSNPDIENLRPGQIIKTREFWVLWMTFFLNTQPIGYINSMYKVNGAFYMLKLQYYFNIITSKNNFMCTIDKKQKYLSILIG